MKRFPSKRGTRIVAALAVASGTLGLASIVGLSSSAQADPAWTSSYVGVGADVTQDLYAGLAGVSPAPPYTGTPNYFTPLHTDAADGSRTISSFDANPFGGTTVSPGGIATKLGGPTFDRPNSTTAGLAALVAEDQGTGWQNSTGSFTGKPVVVTGQFDFARAARGPKTAGSILTFIPFGRDALGVLIYNGGGHLTSLSTAQLNSLYSSSTGTITINGDTVRACLTLSGSTPRSNLESAIGVNDATADIAAANAGCDGIEQNNGNKFYANATASTTLSSEDSVIPISSGSWIGQANGVGLDRSNLARTGGVDLASITDGTTALGKPYSGTAPNEVPSTTYYQSSKYGYNVYTVVPTDVISGSFGDTGLESLFVGSSSALCTTPYQSIVHQFGFDSLTGTEGSCGTTTQTGNG